MTGPAPAAVAGADAIVVGAGASSRMGGIDKLAWRIAGRPLFAHTVGALADAPGIARIVVVTAADRVDQLRAEPWLPGKVVAVVAGGQRRQDSVAAGLGALLDALGTPGIAAADRRVVLIHDGARPVIRPALLGAIIEAAGVHGAAIPVLPVAETVKRVAGTVVVETVDRAHLVTAQTPQGMQLGVLRRAMSSPVAAAGTWTDEAALLEACRIPVHVIPGDPDNHKVTVPADLAPVADLLAPDGTLRHGVGHDSHPFGPGTPLLLGGVTFDGVPRLAGHSDGDVVLHAVADALLGAAALGDLGRVFPAGPATPAGIASTELLAAVVGHLRDAGWRPVRVDVTVTAARPRLADRLPTMAAAIGGVLGLGPGGVSVKASTGNLDGADGAGRTISALALATIAPLEVAG